LTAGEEEELLEKIKTKATIFETPVGRKRLERSLAAVTRTAVVNARDTLLGLIEAREAKEAEVSARAARVALRKAATVAKKALLAEKKAARALEDALGEKAYPTTSSAISSSEAIPTAASRPRKRKRSVSATSVLSDAHVSAETSEIETSSRGRPKKRKATTERASYLLGKHFESICAPASCVRNLANTWVSWSERAIRMLARAHHRALAPAPSSH